MDLRVTRKIGDAWHTFAKIETNKYGKEQMNISLSNARKLVAIIEQEGREFKGEKYLYIPVYPNKPKEDNKPKDTNSFNLDDEIPF